MKIYSRLLTTLGKFVLFSVLAGGSLLYLKSILAAPAGPKAEVIAVTEEKLRAASELTTVIFSAEMVVPAEDSRRFVGHTIGTSKLLYIAYGELRAGVDLKDVEINVSASEITVTLPAAAILDSKIDVNKSTVYDYNKGFLGLGPDSAPILQETAQRQALVRLTQLACERGIIKEAEQKAIALVESLISREGVIVTVIGKSSMACSPGSLR